MTLKTISQKTAMRNCNFVQLTVAILCTLFISEVTTAQYAEQKFGDTRGQWFVGFGAGPRIYFADHAKQLNIIDRLSLGADLYVGRWMGPYVGTRVGFSFQTLKGATQEGFHKVPEPRGGYYIGEPHFLWKQQFDAWHFYGDLLFDVSNIFQGPDEFRFWSLVPFVGIGHVNTWDKPTGHEVTFNVGLLNTLQLSRTVDLNFDIRGAMFKERFKVGAENYPAPPTGPHDTGERPLDGILSVNVGVTFRFGGNSIPKPAYYPEPVRPVPPPVREPVIEKVTEWKDVATDVLILFQINQSVLLRDARVQIGFLARLMHEYPEGTYTITGYADEGTGTPNINSRLSRERAQRVKDCLIQEYGISPSRLKTVAAGGIENRFYNDPALSRSVIIRPDK